ncbi:hypothetical protein LIA77_11315 [Sarocladium implicatum]|nr:hypothetical protein LIA77_11315 [Sarocladium implicatum]
MHSRDAPDVGGGFVRGWRFLILSPSFPSRPPLLRPTTTSRSDKRRRPPRTSESPQSCQPAPFSLPLADERTRANPAEAPRRLGTRRHDAEDLVDGEASKTKKEQKDAENAEGQAAGGKKKKVTAAQLRVQKGTTLTRLDDANRVSERRRHPALHPDYRAGRGHVPRGQVHIRLQHQPKLPSRAAQGPVSREDLPPQHRPRGQGVPKYPAGGLEAGAEPERGDCRASGESMMEPLRYCLDLRWVLADWIDLLVPVPRAQRFGPAEQGGRGGSAE